MTLATILTCRSLAPDIANISPLKYSLLYSALRSMAKYSSGVKYALGCRGISCSVLKTQTGKGFLVLNRSLNFRSCSCPGFIWVCGVVMALPHLGFTFLGF